MNFPVVDKVFYCMGPSCIKFSSLQVAIDKREAISFQTF